MVFRSARAGDRWQECVGLWRAEQIYRQCLQRCVRVCVIRRSGHNWGSPHDPVECTPSADLGGEHIMYWVSVSGRDANNKVHFIQLSSSVDRWPSLWSQWSSGSISDCSARGPGIESRCGQLCLSYNHCDLQPWARAVCTLPAVPRSTQPSTLRGTVNENQLSGWVIIINGDGGCRR